jgi:mycofactocin system FadH/OYE family oxidoreductase 1
VKLVEPVRIGEREAPSRVVFGPHETNLADGRSIGERHVAYYERRARGGAGVIVTETASVNANDWPYERAPLAELSGPGWRAAARACAPYGTVVLAGIGHAGNQGSSAYSQEVMWAPSRVADVVSREPPAELEEGDISALVQDFARSAAAAVAAGLAGVEVDAGAHALLRQFHSGLTNLRPDRYGADRLLFTHEVLAAVRRAVGRDGIVALRLSCDELAPWAGVTPEQAAEMVESFAGAVDLLTVVKAGPFSSSAYRPDAHTPQGFNRGLCAQMRSAAGGRAPVVLQGSVVDPAFAETALQEGVCDLVEMTRAQIADADLVRKSVAGQQRRPCIRCNQACRVRDPRNPIVSCVVDPASGHETEEPYEPPARSPGPPVLVVGAGPAGLECARILAAAGRRVRVAERAGEPGGTLARAAVGPGRQALKEATDWLVAEAGRAGVEISLSTEIGVDDLKQLRAEGWEVVLATGGRPLSERWPKAATPVLDPLAAFQSLPDGSVAVLDPIGDQVGVGIAEWLAVDKGRPVALVSPDPVAGNQLALTGDLADANGRLQRAGVRRELRRIVRGIGDGEVLVEDCWTGEPAAVPAASVIDCGHRVPEDSLYWALGDPTVLRAGDCIAPRSLLHAVLEGRRAALRLLGVSA